MLGVCGDTKCVETDMVQHGHLAFISEGVPHTMLFSLPTTRAQHAYGLLAYSLRLDRNLRTSRSYVGGVASCSRAQPPCSASIESRILSLEHCQA